MSDTLSTPETGASQAGMVRALMVAIAIMTLAIFFLLGAIFGRILAPTGAVAPTGAIDFAAAPSTDVLLPAGAIVTDTVVNAERITMHVTLADGTSRVLTTPVTGYEQAVQLRFVPAE